MPSWIEPMAATLTRERFSGPEWVFERKLDGIRLLAFKTGHEVRLLSRNQLPQNEGYPALVEAVAALPVHDLILDGEALGVWRARDALGYHVFDLPWLEGRDLTALTLAAPRAVGRATALAPFAPCGTPARRSALAARPRRRLGGRDRQAAGLPL